MAYENIILELEDGIGILTINRPKKLNALNNQTVMELGQAVCEITENKDYRALIVTGSGEKAFVAGADITGFLEMNAVDGRDFAAKGQEIFTRLENLPIPVIAAVNGFALGGGLELALACQMRIASENAKMGLPEVTLGIIPGFGGTQRLPRTIGKGLAMEMILTGGMIDAGEAYRIGLVNKVVPPEELMDTCKKLAKKTMNNGPIALKLAIEAVNRGLDDTLTEGLRLEANLFGLTASTEDMKEGAKAFLEKRKADFQNK